MAKKMAPKIQMTMWLSSQGRMLKNGMKVDPSNSLKTARIYRQFKNAYHAIPYTLACRFQVSLTKQNKQRGWSKLLLKYQWPS
jgi:hypothetical protein